MHGCKVIGIFLAILFAQLMSSCGSQQIERRTVAGNRAAADAVKAPTSSVPPSSADGVDAGTGNSSTGTTTTVPSQSQLSWDGVSAVGTETAIIIPME